VDGLRRPVLMRIRILGTAAGGGLPQWNCACTNCTRARRGRLRPRRIAALAVCADDGRWVLVNAPCDIGSQLASTPHLWPAGRRANPIACLLLTDANIDHTAGILEFRQAGAFSTYSTALVRRTLAGARMFAPFARQPRRWTSYALRRDSNGVELSVPEAPRLRIRAIPVPGLLPSYAGGQRRHGATVAYAFEQEGARLVYAPIFADLSPGLVNALAGADAVLLDGTCWTDDELIRLGLGTRTARDMGHLPVTGPGGWLARLPHLRARHRFVTHLNNSNPLLDPQSAARRALHRAGFTVPADGLEIALHGTRRTFRPRRRSVR
jgi:pyrroloquinoline quinone biosynthesis protein B